MEPPTNFSFIDEVIAGSAMPFNEKNIGYLQNLGITHIISLSEEPLSKYFPKFANSISFSHFPLYGPPEDQHLIDQFIQIVKKAKANKEKVMVHCQFGQERTGVMLAIYLIEFKSYSVNNAIKKIREERPSSLQSSTMVRFLYNKYGK